MSNNAKLDYLNITDFAKKAGVTRQTVYNRISTFDSRFYNEYILLDNGKKLISTKALKLFKTAEKKTDTNKFDSQNFDTLLKRIEELQNDKEILQSQLSNALLSLRFEQERVAELRQMLNAPTQELVNEHQSCGDNTETPEEPDAPTEKPLTVWERFKNWAFY